MKNKKEIAEINPASKAMEKLKDKNIPSLRNRSGQQAWMEIAGIARHHIIVIGDVQGVGYRKFVVSHALRLNLTGFCKNLPSGEVEVEAEGHPDKIKELIDQLYIGPPRGKVEKVIVSSSIKPQFDSEFVIRY